MSKLAAPLALLLVAMATGMVANASAEKLSRASMSQVRFLLSKQLFSNSWALPFNTVCSRCLVHKISSSGASLNEVADPKYVASILKWRSYPNEVVKKFEAIVYANKVNFELIEFVVKNKVGSYDLYLGAARKRSDGQAELGLIKAWARGSLVRSSNSASQIKLIESALRAFTMEKLRSEIRARF